MKRFLALLCISLLLFTLGCGGQAAAPAPDAAAPAVPETTAAPAETPTPEPTPAPTPSPTPEPQITEIPLDVQMLRSSAMTVTATALRFAPESCIELLFTVENKTNKAVDLTLPALLTYGVNENGEDAVLSTAAAVNGWNVAATLADAAGIPAMGTQACTLTVENVGDEAFQRMRIGEIQTIGMTLLAANAETGKDAGSFDALFENPNADPGYTDAFSAEGDVLLDNKNMTIRLLGADEAFTDIRLYFEKKQSGSFTKVSVDPVFGGYTNLVNNKVSMYKGSRMLYDIDGSGVMLAHGIERLTDMSVYLTFQYAAKIDRAIQLNIGASGGDNVMSTVSLDAPVVYEDQYCILKNLGVDKAALGREVLLLDYENITQTYIKTLDLTVQPAYGTLQIDGKDYPVGLYCTYCYPYTHGYMMIWPVGAPEGTLSAAKTATVRLYITRIHSGHYDPVSGTGWMEIDLTAS